MASRQKKACSKAKTVLHPHDVLFGRGTGANTFPGNQRFRDIVENFKILYKKAHLSSKPHKEKQEIANQVLLEVKSKGGRFMKQVGSHKRKESILTDCVWEPVSDDVALEKVKQSLRQQQKETNKKTKNGAKSVSEKKSSIASTGAPSSPEKVPSLASAATPSSPENVSSIVAPAVAPAVATSMSPVGLPPPVVDSRLLLFHGLSTGDTYAQHQSQQQTTGMPQHIQTFCVPSSAPLYTCGRVSPKEVDPALRDSGSLGGRGSVKEVGSTHLLDAQGSGSLESSVVEQTKLAAADLQDEEESSGHSSQTLDEEVAAFLLSAVEETGQPHISTEELRTEFANMTDEEKAEALSDVFGKMCCDDHKNKKLKRDLDPTSIAFVVKQMRLELERISSNEKQAIQKALQKARREEFCDARLVQFLRCDGFNAKLAAKRFVRYWEGRLEVFGEERFWMPITLNGALCGDVEAMNALETGVLCLLPHLDTSGRQLLFLEPRRHTKIGYSSLSLLRAVWFIIEVTSRQNTDVVSGLVELVDDKHSSVWDYDTDVYSRWTYFETYAWPVKITAFHVLCPPPFIKRVIFPIMMALTDARARARTIVHDVPETDVVKVLSRYGILKHMLPTSVGGDIVLDQYRWIAERGVSELEEI